MPTYHKIHETTRLSTSGAEWGIQIWRLQDEAPEGVGELEPIVDTGLVIEWKETAKHDILCGSIATLTLNSPGNGTYLDLYTDTPGTIQLRVLRNGVLYWLGYLDPEFYEEPFTSGMNYNVTLTFSDFGILDRLKYNLSGFKTIDEILSDCLSRAGLSSLPLNKSYISTWGYGVIGRYILGALCVRSENFYDEDGEALSLAEVLEGVFRPLALRIVQRAGTLYVYDINGLHSGGIDSRIVWGGDGQVLGVDRVYNNLKITLSTYGSDSLSEEFEFTGETELPNGTDEAYYRHAYAGNNTYFSSFKSNYGQYQVPEDLSFRIMTNRTSRVGELLQDNLNFFKIIPIQGGQEAEGFSFLFYSGMYSRHDDDSGWNADSTHVERHGYLPGGANHEGLAPSAGLYRSNKIYVSSGGALRVHMRCLLDVRYNPFTEAVADNEKTALSHLEQTRRLYLPVKIELLDSEDNILYHYVNKGAISSDSPYAGSGPGVYMGYWAQGAADYNDCEFAFDQDTEKWKDSDVNQRGWIDNRQAITMDCARGPRLKTASPGQYMYAPPASGWLRITVCAGMRRCEKDKTPAGDDYAWKNSHDLLRWILFTVPEVTAVNDDATFTQVESKDVEYSGVLNANAKEDLEIDEICGTTDSQCPGAKGLLLLVESRNRVEDLHRAERHGFAEKLLIGTLFSQYAARKAKLTGTVETDGFDLVTLIDNALPGKRLMIMGETQSCLSGDSEITAVEIAPDEYTEA